MSGLLALRIDGRTRFVAACIALEDKAILGVNMRRSLGSMTIDPEPGSQEEELQMAEPGRPDPSAQEARQVDRLAFTLDADTEVEEGICFPTMFTCFCRSHQNTRCRTWSGTSREERYPSGRTYGERKRNFVGQSFWTRGYFVSTVGRDEKAIREYIQIQEKEDQRLEQLNLWK
jgi:hypothetical protein